MANLQQVTLNNAIMNEVIVRTKADLREAIRNCNRCESLNDATMDEREYWTKAHLSKAELQRAKFIDPDVLLKDAKPAIIK